MFQGIGPFQRRPKLEEAHGREGMARPKEISGLQRCEFQSMNPEDVARLQHSILASANANREVGFSEMVQGFYHAVNWSEPWIIALLATHVVLLVVRRPQLIQTA